MQSSLTSGRGPTHSGCHHHNAAVQGSSEGAQMWQETVPLILIFLLTLLSFFLFVFSLSSFTVYFVTYLFFG
jgi:heme/copper-type cytochrome/quinol oxidase subunit 4